LSEKLYCAKPTHHYEKGLVMANKVDINIAKVLESPILSGPTLVAGLLSTVSFSVAFAYCAVSPVLCGGLAVTAGIGVMRDRTKLSKIFSVAAAASAVTALAMFATGPHLPDFGNAVYFVYTGIGAGVASAFNIASHYTRNMTLSFQTGKTEQSNETLSPPQP
jgi:hypothetical protein